MGEKNQAQRQLGNGSIVQAIGKKGPWGAESWSVKRGIKSNELVRCEQFSLGAREAGRTASSQPPFGWLSLACAWILKDPRGSVELGKSLCPPFLALWAESDL